METDYERIEKLQIYRAKLDTSVFERALVAYGGEGLRTKNGLRTNREVTDIQGKTRHFGV